MFVFWAALLLAQAGAPGADPPAMVPRLALEVLNPDRTGRRIFHFDDVVGPEARVVGPFTPAKAMLVLATQPNCASCDGDLALLAKAQESARSKGGLVMLVVQARPKDALLARSEAGRAQATYIVALDTAGLTRRRLGLGHPGACIVVRGNGQVRGNFGPIGPIGGQSPLVRCLLAFEEELKEESS